MNKMLSMGTTLLNNCLHALAPFCVAFVDYNICERKSFPFQCPLVSRTVGLIVFTY